ncbi:phosphotransferase [Aureimonas leprariae]|uniref:Phosphotransferase n=1 Tax=Plantimonas leprariae TaxID=2615207 RepID=A0A7V7PKI9_9HYPH|nr:phosphotransferase [Aureimonas leprariae]KAB0676009.1 phosphotransferase [Aureimonas leprariae]
MTFHGGLGPEMRLPLPEPAVGDFLDDAPCGAAEGLFADGARRVRSLAGHSGCEVSLMIDGDDYYVRKVSASPAYNDRLVAQMEKQQCLSTLISTPAVMRRGEEAGRFWFDMEFVLGDGFLTFAPLQSVARIPDFVRHLVEPLEILSAAGRGYLDPGLFEAKLAELQRTVPASAWFGRHADSLGKVFGKLASFEWRGIPQTPCHGDLTVENMLIGNDGSIVFIDLLDGDLETVWMDAAKLVQDLESGWSMRAVLWRRETDAAARLMRMLGQYLSDEFQTQMVALHPDLARRLPGLRAIQALRVLPYVQDAATFDHVVAGIAAIEFERGAE